MSYTLAPYHMVASYFSESFDDVTFKHISRVRNIDAYELDQIAFGAQLLGGELGWAIQVVRRPYPALVNHQVFKHYREIRTRVMFLPSLLEREMYVDVYAVEALPND